VHLRVIDPQRQHLGSGTDHLDSAAPSHRNIHP
jgi:hypothetical protein